MFDTYSCFLNKFHCHILSFVSHFPNSRSWQLSRGNSWSKPPYSECCWAPLPPCFCVTCLPCMPSSFDSTPAYRATHSVPHAEILFTNCVIWISLAFCFLVLLFVLMRRGLLKKKNGGGPWCCAAFAHSSSPHIINKMVVRINGCLVSQRRMDSRQNPFATGPQSGWTFIVVLKSTLSHCEDVRI